MININKLKFPREPSSKPILKEPDIFNSDDEMKNSLNHIFYGDLYIMGRIWIETLKSVLIGTKFSIFKIPAVKAAPPKEEIPTKPGDMPASSLPLYESPHRNFKEYNEDQSYCSDVNTKIMHQLLQPYVSGIRQGAQEFGAAVKFEFKDTCNDIRWHYRDKKSQLIKRMRDPANTGERAAVVALGGLFGYLYAHKNKTNKIFYASLGLLATGALCFPEDTDCCVKHFCYYFAKGFLIPYNKFFDTNCGLREKLPCKDSIIIEPKKNQSKGNPCPIPGKK